MARKGSELVDVSVLIRASTERALLVSEGLKDSDGKEVRHWLPLSQIDFVEGDASSPETVVLAVPRWLCEEKGLTID